MLINGKINKLQYIYTVGNYSSIKRKKVLIHGTMWKNFRNMTG